MNLKVGHYLISLLPIVLVAAFRAPTIGADTDYYVENVFDTACNSKNLFDYISSVFYVEPFYAAWNFFVSIATTKFYGYLFITHYMMYSLIIYSLYRLRNNLNIWIGIFIFLFVFYRESLNTARQACALYIDMVSLMYLLRNRYKVAVFLAILAIGFHYTNIIYLGVIIAFLLIKRNPRFWNISYVKFSIVCLLLIMILGLSEILSLLSTLDETISSNYNERYANAEMFGAGLPLSLFSLNIINLAVFYFLKFRLLKFHVGNDYFLIFTEYVMIMALLSCFAGQISTFAVRIGDYFLYMSVLLLPILYKKYKTPLFFQLVQLAFCIVYWFLTVVVANLGETYPYEFTKEI